MLLGMHKEKQLCTLIHTMIMQLLIAPTKGNDEDQDWTTLFQHDLYPGKKMSLGFNKHSNRQSLRSKAGQPLGTWIWSEIHSLSSYCTNPTSIREEKYCAPSLKSMMDFSISKLGKNIKVISSYFAQNQDQYVIEEVNKIGDNTVMWHRLNLEKVVFYCHQVNMTTAYMVPLVASDGTKAKALTICHHDTRGMDPKIAPIKGDDEDQDWTTFFQHDLYPGKKMSLGINKHSNRQSLRSKAGQPLGTWIWSEIHSLSSYCTNPTAIREEKYCAPSLKSMMDFAISKLGKNNKVILSYFPQNQDQYVIEEVNKIGDNTVMCHRLNLENVVFYCHQVNATTAYMVPLVASDGIKAKALTICHHDTRGMDPKVLYEVLNVKPGTIPICHFVRNKAIAWVPNHDGSDHDNNHPYVQQLNKE
ncbi:unnamed protein product [Vicia faba]|uniref:BURP domain-containing protein n=1 Tax=Vicia faba TaxID=3906 RepID=A0AAV1A8W5_VICFA|nr:unnamed protein product [Vicia faba]